MDFIRGASLSEGGKPIIALTSRTKNGASRIVPILKPGAGVVTPRAHVHYVVTEYGIADLYGKTLAERAKSLAAIAHPEMKDMLLHEWKMTMAKNPLDVKDLMGKAKALASSCHPPGQKEAADGTF